MNMIDHKSLVARAFEIAPQCASNKHLRAWLKSEGYSVHDITAHFAGKGLRVQLKGLRVSKSPKNSRL